MLLGISGICYIQKVTIVLNGWNSPIVPVLSHCEQSTFVSSPRSTSSVQLDPSKDDD